MAVDKKCGSLYKIRLEPANSALSVQKRGFFEIKACEKNEPQAGYSEDYFFEHNAEIGQKDRF